MDKAKKDVMVKGASLHLVVYIAIAAILSLLGVPSVVVFGVLMVLLWGLFVLSYGFYHKA